MAIIRTFELDTSNITVNKTIRQLRVTGDIGCEFILQAVQKSTSSIDISVNSTFHMNERVVHDRLVIMWFETGTQEEMPDVLVELVSSVINTKKTKKA